MKNVGQAILEIIIVGAVVVGIYTQSFAQYSDEDIYDIYDKKELTKDVPKPTSGEEKVKDIESISELSTLEPFADVAVIQRKFLPTSGRFELSGSGMFGLNNPFFTNLGGAMRMAYFFNSRWSLEASYYALSASEKDVTTQLKKRRVKTESLVTPKSYSGATLRWTPIYGKMALLGTDIHSFETFFALGAGSTETSAASVPTIHFGGGQNYAITKSMAFRWDGAVNYYQPEVVFGNRVQKLDQYDILISVGLSFYFPEATYR